MPILPYLKRKSLLILAAESQNQIEYRGYALDSSTYYIMWLLSKS